MVASSARVWLRPARFITIGLCLLILATLLVACGDAATVDNNFDVPPLDGMTLNDGATNNDALRSKILIPASNSNTVVRQKMSVYTTTRAITDLQGAYDTEMTKRGWSNVSDKITGSGERGADGLVRAYEKFEGGDVNRKHAAGVIMLKPEIKDNDIVNTLRNNGTIAKDANVIILVQGATGVPEFTAGSK